MRKMKIAALASVLALSLAACSGTGANNSGDNSASPSESSAAPSTSKTVGVAMPEQTLERWQNDGKAVEEGFKAAGFDVQIQFGGNDVPTQQQQVDQMITKGVDLLVIAAIDGASLSSQLDQAEAAGIPVIAYDRLLTGNKNVDFYVTFDNTNVGVQQGTSLLQGLGVLDADGKETGEKGPFNIELFAGSPDDNNAQFFFNGAMSVLKPYIDSGVLKVGSGQTEFGQVATQGWDQAKAQSRMDNLITSSYLKEKVHGVYASNDALGRGAITALENAGYTTENIPVVTGQDAEIISANWINKGLQFSTIFKDTRKLAVQAVAAGTDLLNGKTPEINDDSTYDNGFVVVPSFLLASDVVTKESLKTLLVDSGYYTMEQIEKGSTD